MKKLPDLVASVAIEIDRGAPRCLVLFRVVRSEATQVISDRAEMVINHVEQHREPLFMTGVNETFSDHRVSRTGGAVHINRRRRSPSPKVRKIH